MKIFIGNISKEITEKELENIFEDYGQVDLVKIIYDKFTGDSRGFGFLWMQDENQAQTAITKLNGTFLKGQALHVNEARTHIKDRRGSDRRQREKISRSIEISG
jgi:RNA recognition motif-containing protein